MNETQPDSSLKRAFLLVKKKSAGHWVISALTSRYSMADQTDEVENALFHLVEHQYATTSCEKDSAATHTASTFAQFTHMLQQHEITTHTKYINLSLRGQMNGEKIQLQPSHRILWDGSVPFIVAGAKTYMCHQGKDRNIPKKKKYAEKRDKKAIADLVLAKRHNWKQPTKKLDCPAMIRVKRVLRFCDYKVTKKTEKAQQIKAIRSKIEANEQLQGEDIFLFNLPDISEHKNHSIGIAAAVTEPLDPRVLNKIKELARKGKRDTSVISELLEEYVQREIGDVNKVSRRFYPNKNVIRHIARRVENELRTSKVDRTNTEKLIKKWDERNVYFRPPCNVIETQINILELDRDGNEAEHDLSSMETHSNSLVFVFQSDEMRRLYKRYGSTVLLDATHKTFACALPLYFLVVKGNVNYQVVAVIITQSVMTKALTEGLKVIRDWNPDVRTQYAMVDNAAEEISALEDVFEDIRVFICIFYREQAWSRWASSQENVALPKDAVLGKLRRVGNASSEKNLQKAITDLMAWDLYATTPLRDYFESTWLPEITRWAVAYRPGNLPFDTNKGVEWINEELKNRYLKDSDGLSLSEMIETVTDKFIPANYRAYIEGNVAMLGTHRKYSQEIPDFLHNRPKWFIDHILKKIATAQIDGPGAIQIIDDSIFKVSSNSTSNTFCIVHLNLNEQTFSCTCADFCKKPPVCKHILQVGMAYPDYKIDRLAQWLLSDPIYCADKEVLCFEEKTERIETEMDVEEQTETLNDTNDTEEVNAAQEDCEELPARDIEKENLLMKCNATVCALQSVMPMLPKDRLAELDGALSTLYSFLSSQVVTEKDTALPVRDTTEIERAPCTSKRKIGKQTLSVQKKSKHVGIAEDVYTASTNVNKQLVETTIENECNETPALVEENYIIIVCDAEDN